MCKGAAVTRVTIFVGLVILTFSAILWTYGLRNELVPCLTDCGETFVAKHQVRQFQRYAFRYGLLQDHATSDDLPAHPFLYTHNVSIPAILFPMLAAIGFTEFWVQQLITLAAYALGLFYAFKATSYHTRSAWAGGVMLLLFATDYVHVYSFGLNALRAWHWLALFGLLYHVGRISLEKSGSALGDRLAIAALALVAFGIGYDFWAICLFLCLAMVVLCLPHPAGRRRIAIDLIWLGAAFGVPVILRQFHVASVLGLDFWWKDFVLSAGIKVPLLKELIPLPPMHEIERIYREFNVVRPPASPAPDWAAISKTLQDMVKFIVIPSFGMLGIGLMLLAIAVGVFIGSHGAWRQLFDRRIAPSDPSEPPVPAMSAERIWQIQLLGGLRLLVVLAVGVAAGLAFFAPLSLHIYLKHEFPLIAAPVLLAKALVISGLSYLFWRLFLNRSRMRWLVLAGLLVIVIDHGAIQLRDIQTRRPISTSWIPEAQARASSSFAVSWIADAVAGFTSSWAVGVLPGQESDIAQRFRSGHRPFEFSDYFLFGQRDRAARGDAYLYPDYWLYFPTEHGADFDRVSPECSKDHWHNFWRFATRRRRTDFAPTADLWVQKGSVFAKGSAVALGGQLRGPDRGLSRVEVRDGGRALRTLNYNCIYRSFAGALTLDPADPRLSIGFEIYAVSDRGAEVRLGTVSVMISDNAHKYSRSELRPWSREPQPSVEAMIAMNPSLPVAVAGKDFVMFDMKETWAKQAKRPPFQGSGDKQEVKR